ncbi:carbohydrate ABC transporter permease [Acidaminobacter sp. JC074]|uniref:carbohydrate ABC transporter permease n=1 Tax=Acidaminobacter sp. JC074 TaxID=2530199 RepID=UPI001F101914|nr:carbohydrate ABC transporter permease [Acidaminobacter sp. JC074]MCH4887505.1 carbohydrate ABC transporter permease [Acidaminobacter sp. JC074]
MRKKLSKPLSLIVLGFVAIIFVFPFYWIITGAFKIQEVTILETPQWFPLDPTFDNWISLFKNPAFVWLRNSFIISLSTMILVCVTASLAGYALAKKDFKGKELIFGLLIAAMALPKQVILVPLVQIVNSWGLHNTLLACILPAVGFPFGIFLMKQFSETLPKELLEAAKIDGCNEIGIFIKIVLPLIKPGIGALAIFTFISSWNDYFLQLVMLVEKEKLTMPLGVALMQQEFSTNYGVLMAGATLACIPIIIIFIVFQKNFTQGITMGAVKG